MPPLAFFKSPEEVTLVKGSKKLAVEKCSFCGVKLKNKPTVIIRAEFSNSCKKTDGTIFRFDICEDCYDREIESQVEDFPF